MDLNEFSFEALFKSTDFVWYDSPKVKASAQNFNQLLKSKISDHDTYDKISCALTECSADSLEAGFEQGFLFALRLIKGLYDMSFPGVPPITQ